MKKNILTALFALFAATLFAQTGTFTFFTEDGEKFWLTIDGLRQNPDPRTSVTAEYSKSPVDVKIQFQRETNHSINHKLVFDRGSHTTYVLRNCAYRNSPYFNPNEVILATNGVYDLRFYSARVKGRDDNVGHTLPGNDVIVNHDGHGHVDHTGHDHSGTVTHTTTTTVTTGGGTTVVEPNIDETEPVIEEVIVYVPGYTGPVGCPVPMSDQEFSDARESVKSKISSFTKMTVAKQITRNNCLTVSQVKQLTKLFMSEFDKVEYAKYAYDFTYDRGNYYKVSDEFNSSFSIDELDEYIRGKE